MDYSDYHDFLLEHWKSIPKSADAIATAFYESGIRASCEYPGDLIVHYVRRVLSAPYDVRIYTSGPSNRILLSLGAQTFESILPKAMVDVALRFYEGQYPELAI